MARKNIVASYAMIDAGDLSGNLTSEIVNVQNMDKGSVHLSWAGASPVGVVTVQARNGANDAWFNLSMGSAIAISGSSGDHQLIFNEMPFTDIRLQYTSTSGTGSMDAIITLKQTGG